MVTIIEVDGGYGVEQHDDDKNIHIKQDFMPGVQGFRPMTLEEAEAIKARLEAGLPMLEEPAPEA